MIPRVVDAFVVDAFVVDAFVVDAFVVDAFVVVCYGKALVRRRLWLRWLRRPER